MGPWQMMQGIVEFGVWNVALKDVLLMEYKLSAVATLELFSVDLLDISPRLTWHPPEVL
jgi:hypothetical protein